MRDFPAAHSMDTTWFAIDEDGRVGVFDSGENGAVPIDAASAGGASDASFDLFPLEAALIARSWKGDDALDAAPLRAKSRVVVAFKPSQREPKGGYRASAASNVEAMLAVPTTVLREADPRIVMTNEPITPEIFAKLAADDAVVGLYGEHDLSAVLYEEDDVGLFRFSSDDLGQKPGAYGRSVVPATPIRVDDLPRDAREHVQSLRLPIRFEEHYRVDLADHMSDAQVAMYSDNVTLRGDPIPVATPQQKRRPNYLLLVIVVVIMAILVWLKSKR